MGILDGGLAAVFGEAFGGLYLDGALIVPTRVDDDNGDVTETPAHTPIKYQMEAATERWKAFEGYTARSVLIRVLQIGPDGRIARPNGDCKVSVDGATWEVSGVVSDTANTYWDLLCNPA